MTRFVLCIVGFVLIMTGLVLRESWFVPNITGLVLDMIGFIVNINEFVLIMNGYDLIIRWPNPMGFLSLLGGVGQNVNHIHIKKEIRVTFIDTV